MRCPYPRCRSKRIEHVLTSGRIERCVCLKCGRCWLEFPPTTERRGEEYEAARRWLSTGETA